MQNDVQEILSAKCSNLGNKGICFKGLHVGPQDYMQRKADAEIWIVSLNPYSAKDSDNIIISTKEELEQFSPYNKDNKIYYNRFKKVSQILYNNWKSDRSVIAHTDLVKCLSAKFPPEGFTKTDKKEMINNCKDYLFSQIKKGKPKILICNGADVSYELMRLFNYKEDGRKSTKFMTSIKLEDGSSHFFG